MAKIELKHWIGWIVTIACAIAIVIFGSQKPQLENIGREINKLTKQIKQSESYGATPTQIKYLIEKIEIISSDVNVK